MIEFKTYYHVSNSKHIKVRNVSRIVAISSRLCTNVHMRGIDPTAYYEKWKIVKEDKGYIFREVTHNGGICGHHKTLRSLIISSGGLPHIKIVLLDEDKTETI